jgi:hypothetical protein
LRCRWFNLKKTYDDKNSAMKAKTTLLLSIGTACLSILWASSIHADSELSVTKDQNKTAYSIKSTNNGAGQNGNGAGDTFSPGGQPIDQGKSRRHHKGQRSGKGSLGQKPYAGQKPGQPPSPGNPAGQPPAPGGPPGKPMGQPPGTGIPPKNPISDQQQSQPPASGSQLNF